MNSKQFFDKVALMRRLQKGYFRTRSQSVLRQSKVIENIIDNEIERAQKIIGETPKMPEQANLFGEQR